MEQNSKAKEWIKIGSILLAALAAGTGGSAIHQRIEPPRPDPCTGTECAAVRASLTRINARIDDLRIPQLREEVTALKSHRGEMSTGELAGLIVGLRLDLSILASEVRGMRFAMGITREEQQPDR